MLSNTAYIALGSNLGDRSACIHQAIACLDADALITVELISPIIETAPVGTIPQGNYLNAVICIKTGLDPYELLEALLYTEKLHGRIRREKWGPRTIDLDLLFYNELIIDNDPGLILPHPRMHQRFFVLQPLAAITPELVHPVLGKTIAILFSELNEKTVPPSRAPSLPPAR